LQPVPRRPPRPLKARQRLGKYRIDRRIAQGGFADVYQAFDTVEGIAVALKIPPPHLMTEETLADFKREVRLTARLDHPNILPIKNAEFIDERFVVAYPLGDSTLSDRLTRRISAARALDYGRQLISALAHSHGRRIIHCDVKPDNVILFQHGQLKLTDFGIAKIALKTMRASGSGTVGYIAPEQAMGRPSFRSDVFSAGLILYRMLSGSLPEWPFEWPPPGMARLQRKVHPDLIALIKKSLRLDPRRRFEDGKQMLDAYERVQGRALAPGSTPAKAVLVRNTISDWRDIQRREFQSRYKKTLETRHECARCGSPVSESMLTCPWCARPRKNHRQDVAFPARCPRCRRGVKLDWSYCAWCHGAAIGPLEHRSYSDKRYVARCSGGRCDGGGLMPFMRYCPWCKQKVQRKWLIKGSRDRCPRCTWGVLPEYWAACPWCARSLGGRPAPGKTGGAR